MKVAITTAYRLAVFVLANYWPKISQVPKLASCRLDKYTDLC